MTTRWCIRLDGSDVPSREEIGGKAHSLARMRDLGLPVPEAFVLPTAVMRAWQEAGNRLPAEAWDAVRAAITDLEDATGRRFGDQDAPLLVSVRSGAAQSMPGMMDTILDLGMCDAVETALAAQSGDPAFARDTHRRFIDSYARTVLGAPAETLTDDDPAALRQAVAAACGQEVPQDPYAQLEAAISAVFASWDSPRARTYRRHRRISGDGGTAVTVQAMVFGNLDDDSGTGVYFTRDPATGAPTPYGDFLPRGQGEDVVSGEVDPVDLDELRRRLPAVHDALLRAGRLLEDHEGDVQDVEFTVERGVLHVLQTRRAKRSAAAAIRIATDLVAEGRIDEAEALRRVTAEQIRSALKARVDPDALAQATVLARGEPACPGIASGRVVDDADDAVELAEDGVDVVLVRHATSPRDVHGMIAATGICTEVGGRTSHAAVVSRELGRPSVVGCGDGAVAALLGRVVTLDGDQGVVYDGELPAVQPRIADDPALEQLARWAAEHPDAVDEDHPLRTATTV